MYKNKILHIKVTKIGYEYFKNFNKFLFKNIFENYSRKTVFKNSFGEVSKQIRTYSRASRYDVADIVITLY